MSVINEMLKDLEKGNRSPANISNLTAPQSDPEKNRVWLWVILFIAIIAFAYFIGRGSNHSKTSDSSQLSPESPHVVQLRPPQAGHAIKNQDLSDSSNMITSKRPKRISLSRRSAKTTSPNIATKGIKKPQIAKKTNHRQDKTIASKHVSTIANKKKPRLIDQQASKKKQTSSPIKILSRKNLANKDYIVLATQWSKSNSEKRLVQLEQLLKNYSEFNFLWYKILAFLQTHDADLFNQYLETAIERFPNNSKLLMLKARWFFKQSNYPQALALIEKSNRQNWSGDDYRFVGLTYQKNQYYFKAIAAYQSALTFKLNPGEINMAMAISYQALGDHANALARFSLARIDPLLSPIQKQFIAQQIAAYQE